MKLSKVIVALFALALFTAQLFSWPVLKEEGTVFIIELQNRPFTIPTAWDSQVNRIRMEAVTEDHAVFVWNKASGILVAFVNDANFESLMEKYETMVFANMNKSLLNLQIGKNKIEKGKVVKVQ